MKTKDLIDIASGKEKAEVLIKKANLRGATG
jgi:hypothetical protein